MSSEKQSDIKMNVIDVKVSSLFIFLFISINFFLPKCLTSVSNWEI